MVNTSANKIENKIGDEGCEAVFNNAKYLSKVRKLNLGSNWNLMIAIEMKSASSKAINGNMKYLRNLRDVSFASKADQDEYSE